MSILVSAVPEVATLWSNFPGIVYLAGAAAAMGYSGYSVAAPLIAEFGNTPTGIYFYNKGIAASFGISTSDAKTWANYETFYQYSIYACLGTAVINIAGLMALWFLPVNSFKDILDQAVFYLTFGQILTFATTMIAWQGVFNGRLTFINDYLTSYSQPTYGYSFYRSELY